MSSVARPSTCTGPLRAPRCVGSRPIWGSPEAPSPPGLPRLTPRRRAPLTRARQAPHQPVAARHPDRTDTRPGTGGLGAGRAGPATGAGGSTGDRERQARHRAGHPAPGGQVFRRGDALVNRFQFVADHRDAFEVKRLCEIVQVARSSFYAWLAAAPARAVRAERGCGVGRADPEDPPARQRPGRAADHRRAQRRRRPGCAGQPQAGRPGDAPATDRRAAAAPPRPHHDPRAGRPEACPTCWAATSPPRRPTSATSATSPTCRSPTGRTCTWPP